MKRVERKRFKGLKEFQSNLSKLTCAAIAPDLRLLGAGDDTAMLTLWGLQDKHPVASYNGLNNCITSVQFSLSERFLFAGAVSGTTVAWDYD